MNTITCTYAYRPADSKRDLFLPTSVVKKYAFSNQAMRAARSRHANPNLTWDIQQNGILSPLTIYTNGTSGLLADGYLRLAIAEELDIKKLPVQVHPNNFRRMRTENGFPTLEPKLAAWCEKYLWRHADHEITRHEIGSNGQGGLLGVASTGTKWTRAVCSCGATWKEEG